MGDMILRISFGLFLFFLRQESEFMFVIKILLESLDLFLKFEDYLVRFFDFEFGVLEVDTQVVVFLD